MIAPIVVFVYSRPKHTEIVLQSLSECKCADQSSLFIFADAAKNEKAAEKVAQVRQIIHDPKWEKAFGKVTIVEAKKNKGLANSVISGVTQIINEFGRVIVVEDDNRVAPDFLSYMNGALDFYEADEKVGFIGAYRAPITIPSDYPYDVFLMGRGSSYAWATWKKTWDLVDWKVSDYAQFIQDKAAMKRFDEFGEDRTAMLKAQMNGSIDSWAIRFSYAMFKHRLYCVLPCHTLVENIGFDGTGVHNVSTDDRFLVKIEPHDEIRFAHVELDERLHKEYCKLFKIPLKLKLKRIAKTVLKS